MTRRIKVDIFLFLQTGEFAGLRLGQSKIEVFSNYPKSDMFATRDYEICQYGDFELHFYRDRLYTIFADFDNTIDGGEYLKFSNLWIFDRPAFEISLSFAKSKLFQVRLNFAEEMDEKLQSIILTLPSNVTLHFEGSEGTTTLGDYRFKAMGLMDKTFLQDSEPKA